MKLRSARTFQPLISLYLLVIISFIVSGLLFKGTAFSFPALTTGPQNTVIRGADLNALYYGAQRTLRGDNVYRPDLQKISFAQELRGPGGTSRFVYPPLMGVLFLPYTPLSLHDAYMLHTLLSVLFFLGALFILEQLLTGPPKKMTALRFSGMVFFLLMLSPVLWFHLERGQSDIFIFFLLVCCSYCAVRSYDIPAGILLGTCIALKLTPALLLLYFLFRNRSIFFIAILTTLSLFIGMSFLQPFPDFLKALHAFSSGGSNTYVSNSLYSIIYNKFTWHWLSPSYARLILYGLAAALLGGITRGLMLEPQRTNAPIDRRELLKYFGSLSLCMILLPTVSFIYNGIYIVFIMAYLWDVNARTHTPENVLTLSIQGLLFFFLAPVCLFTIFQAPPMSYVFSLRPLFGLLLGLIIYSDRTVPIPQAKTGRKRARHA